MLEIVGEPYDTKVISWSYQATDRLSYLSYMMKYLRVHESPVEGGLAHRIIWAFLGSDHWHTLQPYEEQKGSGFCQVNRIE